MKLTDLNPLWLGYGGDLIKDESGDPVPRRENVALKFDCPCGKDHGICIHLAKPLDGGDPVSPHNWDNTGSTFDSLTLTPSIQNIDLGTNTPCWHGYITNGEIVPC